MKRFKNKKHLKVKARTKPKSGRVEKNNVKFIQRAKTTENFHKRQKVLEDKYRDEAQKVSFSFNKVSDTAEQEETSNSEDDNYLFTLNQPLKIKNFGRCTELSEKVQNKNNDKFPLEIPKIFEDNLSECCFDTENKQFFLCHKKDAFISHLDTEFTSDQMERLAKTHVNSKCFSANWPFLKRLNIELKDFCHEDALSITEKFYTSERKRMKLLNSNHLTFLGVKEQIANNTPVPLSFLQSELFAIINNYHDLYFNEKSFENSSEIQFMYCLHALNHMLKTRSRIIHHNGKLSEASTIAKSGIIPESYRDQGLTRPKILFILPNRHAAFNVVNILIQLLQGNNTEASKLNGTIVNYSRFAAEYTGNELHFPKSNPKPEDYETTFTGNTDDNFRIGLALTKKCLKLYTDFYASDILIASPLGLRTIIGVSGSKERDFDFLNSIELLIIDQAELLIAQNWENMLHVLDHMHLPPQNLRDTDFQRVRHWYLNGFARFYRQTLLFATHDLPEFRALFNKFCNYEGKVRTANPIEHGTIRNVIVSLPQLFQRIQVSGLEDIYDQRFKYFTEEILPKFRSPSFAHCMIFIPSYFDFVRLRNYFKEETISCVQICEYTKAAKIARARDLFFHSGAQFLLYSERSHFFRRTRIKGIRHLIMYQLPLFPQFFSEIINFMHESNQNSRDGLHSEMSITVLYTKYDMIQLSAIVGTNMAMDLLNSTQSMQYISADQS